MLCSLPGLTIGSLDEGVREDQEREFELADLSSFEEPGRLKKDGILVDE